MSTALLFNRVKVATATTGTGTVTLGAAVTKYCTFAEAGVADTNVVTYTIEDGNDFEIGRGTYTASGTTLSRDTVLLSKIAGTAGTSKISLSGTATVFLTAAKEDLDVNDFTAETTIVSSDLLWLYDASVSAKRKATIENVVAGLAATQAEQETGTAVNRIVTPGRQHFHPSAIKAWVAGDENGTVDASYNLTSVTDGGTGLITFTWATDFGTTNYCAVVSNRFTNGTLYSGIASRLAGSLNATARDAAGALADPSNHYCIAVGDHA